jgi:hypothetical protein
MCLFRAFRVLKSSNVSRSPPPQQIQDAPKPEILEDPLAHVLLSPIAQRMHPAAMVDADKTPTLKSAHPAKDITPTDRGQPPTCSTQLPERRSTSASARADGPQDRARTAVLQPQPRRRSHSTSPQLPSQEGLRPGLQTDSSAPSRSSSQGHFCCALSCSQSPHEQVSHLTRAIEQLLVVLNLENEMRSTASMAQISEDEIQPLLFLTPPQTGCRTRTCNNHALQVNPQYNQTPKVTVIQGTNLGGLDSNPRYNWTPMDL